MNSQQLRFHIRKMLTEEINNFIEKQPETAIRQLQDNSQSKVLGDPISDVPMNQQANELGSDGKNAPTVSVTASGQKGGNDYTTGQHNASFSDSTELAK